MDLTHFSAVDAVTRFWRSGARRSAHEIDSFRTTCRHRVVPRHASHWFLSLAARVSPLPRLSVGPRLVDWLRIASPMPRICSLLNHCARPDRSSSVRVPIPFPWAKLTQRPIVHAVSLSNSRTWRQLVSWLTDKTPWRRSPHQDTSHPRPSYCSPTLSTSPVDTDFALGQCHPASSRAISHDASHSAANSTGSMQGFPNYSVFDLSDSDHILSWTE